MPEYLIPVVFDVNAATESEAARMLADYLALRFTPTGEFPERGIESWFFPKREHKSIDRNDRPAYSLEEVDHV